jgi:CPA2 family monovalent cation:H+ antiporter-2
MDDLHALTQISIILGAAFIGGAIFRKLHQPALVGYIIVGLLLGSSVFGVVDEQEQVSLLAELGILLLLFIVGMEIDLTAFRAVSKIAIITCGVQIGVGLLAMLVLGLVFDWPINRSILLGFAIAISSTAVALKILGEMGLLYTKIGQSSVGILVAQDLAFIPMVLIVGALNSAEGVFNYGGLIRLAFAILFLGGLIYLLASKPKIFQKLWNFFQNFKADMMTGQVAITALAICFSAAAVAGVLGLSAAYGAFLAGIALGHTVSKSQLQEQTRPIFDVTIMVFFLSIGLLIDVQFIWNNLGATLSLLFITMLLKTVVNVLVLRWQGMEKEEAYITGAALGQVGEFSFILAAIGLSTGAIQDEGYKYVVAIISLSLLTTPLWLFLVKEKRGLIKHLRRAKVKKDKDAPEIGTGF